MKRIGRYRILGDLGKGGMGVVYRAVDTLLERQVALKTQTIRGATTEPSVRRFLREAQVIASIKHPNIVTVYDLGWEDSHLFIAMELLEGEDLAGKLRARRHMSVEEGIRIVHEVGAGLAHAHAKGIVHRDIKPRNVFVTHEGEVKLLDFGLAYIAHSTLTDVGQVLGTPFYMSPEQVLGEKPDPRSDIFALGSVFYELLTGDKAFGGANVQETFSRIVHHEPTPIRDIEPHLPEELSRILSKMLTKSPARRYARVTDLLRELERFRRFFNQHKAQVRREMRRTVRELSQLVERHRGHLAEEGKYPATDRLVRTADREDLSYTALVGLRDAANIELRRLEKLVSAAELVPNPADETITVYVRPGIDANDTQDRMRKEGKAEQAFERARERFAAGDFAGSLLLVSSALRISPEHAGALELAERIRQSIVALVDRLEAEAEAKHIDVLVAAILAMDESGGDAALPSAGTPQDSDTIASLSEVVLRELPAGAADRSAAAGAPETSDPREDTGRHPAAKP